MQKPDLHNVEAESALVGAVLIGGNEVLSYRAVSYIKASHFFDDKHRLIWQTVLKMREERESVDIITIADRLSESGVDLVFLQSTMDACASFVRADSYATIIIEHAKRRYAEVVMSNLGAAVYDNGNFENALNTSIEILTRIKFGGPEATLPWDVYTLADAYRERKPLVYVVDELFCLPSLNIVYGSPGCLKSMLLADMALCVAAGIPWLESPPGTKRPVGARQTVSVPVLWLDFDNGTRRTHERIDALASSRALSADETSFYYVSMPTPWLCADDERSIDDLAGLASERSAGMIVIDNLGTVSGNADENSGDMIQVFANLRKLAEMTGCAVIVVHHQRKSTGFKTRAGESLRGHSSIEGALDLALLVEREDHSPNVNVKSTKTRGTDVAPFGATFAYTHKDNSNELAGAQFFGVPVKDNRRPSRATRAIIGVIEESEKPPQKMELIRAAQEMEEDIGINYFRDTITAMVQAGDIVERDTGTKNARVYSLG